MKNKVYIIIIIIDEKKNQFLLKMLPNNIPVAVKLIIQLDFGIIYFFSLWKKIIIYVKFIIIVIFMYEYLYKTGTVNMIRKCYWFKD